MLVLGAGLQGSACAYDLLQQEDVEGVVLADVKVGSLPPFLERYQSDPRLEVRRLDARDESAVLAAMEAADACMNALPYYFNLDISALAIRAGVHYADLGGNTDIVFGQLDMEEQARERGVSLVPDCGLAPGTGNILAAHGIRALEEPKRVRIFVGGLPQDPEPPLNYQVVYSLEGVLDYYTTLAWIVRDGEPRQIEPLSELERVDFPDPVGALEAFHTGGGLSVMPWEYEGRLDSMEYKTLRYPGHAEIMRAIRELGLLGMDPIRADGQEIAPRKAFIAAVEPRLRRPQGRDLVAARVEVAGNQNGKPRQIVYGLLDFYDEKNQMSAMARTTGFSLAIIGRMQALGRVPAGVATPDRCISADDYLNEFARRQIVIQRSEMERET